MSSNSKRNPNPYEESFLQGKALVERSSRPGLRWEYLGLYEASEKLKNFSMIRSSEQVRGHAFIKVDFPEADNHRRRTVLLYRIEDKEMSYYHSEVHLRRWWDPVSDIEKLSWLAENNPEVLTANARARYEKLKNMTVGRGASPGEEENAKSSMRKMEARYPELAPTPKPPPRELRKKTVDRMKTEKERREFRRHQKAQRSRYESLAQIAETALQKEFGGWRLWGRKFSQDTRNHMIGDAIALWWNREGRDLGIISGEGDNSMLMDLGVTQREAKNATGRAQALIRSFDATAKAVRKAARKEEDKTSPLDSFEGVDAGSLMSEEAGHLSGEQHGRGYEDSYEVKERQLASSRRGQNREYLTELLEEMSESTNRGVRVRAELILMHLGKAVVENQPETLLGNLPADHLLSDKRDRTGARMQKHPIRPGTECPTCKRIAGVTSRGDRLTASQVGDIVDETIQVVFARALRKRER